MRIKERRSRPHLARRLSAILCRSVDLISVSVFACQSIDRFLSVWAEAAGAVSSSWAQSHCDITPRCRTVSRLIWSCWMCTGVCNCCIRRQVISAHLRWWLFIKTGEGKTWCYLQYYSHSGRCSVLCFWDPLRAPAVVSVVRAVIQEGE